MRTDLSTKESPWVLVSERETGWVSRLQEMEGGGLPLATHCSDTAGPGRSVCWPNVEWSRGGTSGHAGENSALHVPRGYSLVL